MITVGGSPVLCGRLTLPSVGRWVFDGRVASDVALSGSVRIEHEGVNAFVGVVDKSAVVGVDCSARVLGGTGGLAKSQAAQHFRSATVSVVLSAILAACGESLDPSTSPAATSASLSSVSLPEGAASRQLSTLCELTGLTWRVRPGGMVWVGADSDELPAEGDALILHGDGSSGRYLAAMDGLWLIPGMRLDPGIVRRVEYEIDETVRVRFWA